MTDLASNDDYRDWIVSIKSRIQGSQIKAAVAVNYAMLGLYWFLGEQIIERQETAKWGDGFLKQMGKDLSSGFPEMKGFSHRNLKYMRQWVQFWTGIPAIGQQAVAQLNIPTGQQLVASLPEGAPQLVARIPWGHTCE